MTAAKKISPAPMDAALGLAAEGVPVFPCNPKTKAPLVASGFKDATTDPTQVREWWCRWPDALIGMPTGAVTGISVLDIDSGKRTSPDPKVRAQGESAQWRARYAGERHQEARQQPGGGHPPPPRVEPAEGSGRPVLQRSLQGGCPVRAG